VIPTLLAPGPVSIGDSPGKTLIDP